MQHVIKILVCVFLITTGGGAGAQQVERWSLEQLDSVMKKAEGPTIINFWATFCKPCLAEMPHFQSLASKYRERGVKLYFVSVDAADAYPKKVQQILSRLKIKEPSYFLTETNADLFCPAVDASWSGAIPATLLLNPPNRFRWFGEEELKHDELEKLILEMLGS